VKDNGSALLEQSRKDSQLGRNQVQNNLSQPLNITVPEKTVLCGGTRINLMLVSRRQLSVAVPTLAILLALAIYAIYDPGVGSISTSSSSTQSIVMSSPSTSASLSSTSTDSSSLASYQVDLQVSRLEKSINNLNLSLDNLMNFYTNASVITLYGNATSYPDPPLVTRGIYNGINNIFLFYDVDIEILYPPSPSLVAISNLTVTDAGEGNVVTAFHIFLNSTSDVYGMVNATADVQQEWTSQGGGQWHIQNESWDFLEAYVQNPH
jgi:hypothetical protein